MLYIGDILGPEEFIYTCIPVVADEPEHSEAASAAASAAAAFVVEASKKHCYTCNKFKVKKNEKDMYA